jgi:hypothetical protein
MCCCRTGIVVACLVPGCHAFAQQHAPAGVAGIMAMLQTTHGRHPLLLLLLQIRARRLALPLLLEFAGWWAAAVWVEGYAAGPAALRFGCGYAAGMLISCVLELRSRERLAAVLTPDSGAAEASGCRAGGAESRARSKAEGLPTSCAAAGAAGASSMLKSSHAD